MNSRYVLKLEKKQQKGFMLIEAMIGILIFSIGILSVLSMLDTSVRTNDIARGISEQSAIAQSQIEQLMPLSWDHPDLASGDHPVAPLSKGRYSITWTVAENAMIDNTKTITVNVAWSERGRPKTVNLVAIKTIY